MSSVRAPRRPAKPHRRTDHAATWPAWTDAFRLEIGPEPDVDTTDHADPVEPDGGDREWAAEHLNDGWVSPEPSPFETSLRTSFRRHERIQGPDAQCEIPDDDGDPHGPSGWIGGHDADEHAAAEAIERGLCFA